MRSFWYAVGMINNFLPTHRMVDGNHPVMIKPRGENAAWPDKIRVVHYDGTTDLMEKNEVVEMTQKDRDYFVALNEIRMAKKRPTVVEHGAMRVEHHDNFTAVYWGGVLAAQVLVGTRQQRESVSVERYADLSTWAGMLD